MEQVKVVTSYTTELAKQLCDLHKSSLPDDITPNLVESYYEFIISLMANPKNGVLTVAHNSEELIGFCFVAFNPGDFSAMIAERRVLLIKSIVKFIFTRPGLIVDLCGSVFGKIILFEKFNEKQCPEVFAICVSRNERSTGVGSRLIKKAADLLTPRGLQYLLAKTSNERAGNFYLKDGFVLVGRQNRIARKLAIYRKKL
jgi:GNAT superfamily N-acetyltransferase